MDDLSRFCCLNSDCPEHGRRGAGDLTLTGRYGPGKARRVLRCRTCKSRLSERKGTPLFDARLAREGRVGPGACRRGLWRPPDRPALTGEPQYRMRYGLLAGEHAHDAHDELVAFSP